MAEVVAGFCIVWQLRLCHSLHRSSIMATFH